MSDRPFTVDGAEKRLQIVQAIRTLHTELGHWPSPGEVADRLSIPRKTLQYHTRKLVEEGRVRRLFGGRALEALPDYPLGPVQS